MGARLSKARWSAIFKVKGVGLGESDLGFRVEGLGFRV